MSSHPTHDEAACHRAREEAAIALLRRREPSAEIRAHLEACPPCGEEYRELAVLPGLLGSAREVLAASPPERPGPHVLERLLDEVGRRRRRRRAALAVLAAAAAVVAVLVVVPLSGLTGAGREGSPAAAPAGPPAPASGPDWSSRPPGTTRPPATGVVAAGSATDAASGARARVDVRPQGVGSAVSVSVHGWPAGRPCRMVVHEAGGRAREVGIWTVSADDASTYVEDVDVAPGSIERVELVDDRTGLPMLDVPVGRV